VGDELYRPADLGRLSGDEVARFYANYLHETASVPFDAAERAYLDDPKVLGRIVDPATRPFFAYHVGATVARVVSALVGSRQNPRLLDLGCGSGSVALLLALGGARVIGIDRHPVATRACQRRQTYYESQFGPLPLVFHTCDAVEFPYAEIGPFDGAYSVFAFNLMQPVSALLDGLLPALAPGGLLAIADGNTQSVANRLLRPNSGPTPDALRAELEEHGLSVVELRFGGLISSPLVRRAPIRQLAEQVERSAPRELLGRAAASYTLIAEKQRPPQSRRRQPPREPRRVGARRPPTRCSNARRHSPRRRLLRRPGLVALSGAFALGAIASMCAFADVCLLGVCC
jgi:SAM-dependent methyltransferase